MKHKVFFGFAAVALILTSRLSWGQTENPATLNPNQCKIEKKQIIVPNILGFKPDEAKNIVEDCNLVWSYSESPATLSYEAMGTVGDQEPSGGTVVTPGTILRGFKSSGIYIPNLIGMTEVEASFLVKNQRFGLNIRYERGPGSIGTVIGQSPANGEFFNSGQAVTITVVEGFRLPTIIGREYGVVVKELEALGLKPTHVEGDLSYGWKSTVPPCEGNEWFPVIKESAPTDGELVSEGALVQLTTERKTLPTFSISPGDICK